MASLLFLFRLAKKNDPTAGCCNLSLLKNRFACYVATPILLKRRFTSVGLLQLAVLVVYFFVIEIQILS